MATVESVFALARTAWPERRVSIRVAEGNTRYSATASSAARENLPATAHLHVHAARVEHDMTRGESAETVEEALDQLARWITDHAPQPSEDVEAIGTQTFGFES